MEKVIRGDAPARNDGLGDSMGGAATSPKHIVEGDMMDNISDKAVGVSLMSGSTSTPTPIVKKESNELEHGIVQKKDATVPDGPVKGNHPR